MPLAARSHASMPTPEPTSSKQRCDGYGTTNGATAGATYHGGVACEHVCYLLPNDRANIAAFLELQQLSYVGQEEDTAAAKTIGT